MSQKVSPEDVNLSNVMYPKNIQSMTLISFTNLDFNEVSCASQVTGRSILVKTRKNDEEKNNNRIEWYNLLFPA